MAVSPPEPVSLEEPIRTFDQCIEIAGKDGAVKHLLLGNGFSIALRPDIFNYKQLSANLPTEEIEALFEKLKTDDYEYVMRRLDEAVEVLRGDPETDAQATKDIYLKLIEQSEQLKKNLLNTIAEKHPKSSSEITDKQYKSCQKFLAHFHTGKKFSLNYDLILYWVYMRFLRNDAEKLSHNDGFKKINFPNSSSRTGLIWGLNDLESQEIHYVHGALHIYADEDLILKYSIRKSEEKSKEKIETLAELIAQAIKQNKYSLYITGGSSEHKMAIIRKNRYLTYCLTMLAKIKGILFIFGHSLRDQDDHVFEMMNKNEKLKIIFISVFGVRDTTENKHILTRINEWRSFYPAKQYILYNAESAQVWKPGEIEVTEGLASNN